jgi:hypothetical protein
MSSPRRAAHQAIATWRDTALEWATTKARGAVRALQPISPPVSTGVAD